MGVVKTHSGSERFRVETEDERRIVRFIAEDYYGGKLDPFFKESLGYPIRGMGIRDEYFAILKGQRKNGEMRTIPLDKWENMKKIFGESHKNQKYESKGEKQRKTLETLDQATHVANEVSKPAYTI
jgi:hypothetical protein